MRLILRHFSAICVQTEEDKSRFERLGASQERVIVTGNSKFDVDCSTLSQSEQLSLLKELKLDPSKPVIVCGSTHSGEEEILIAAIRNLRKKGIECSVLLAPRHPERFENVINLIRQNGFSVSRRSLPDCEHPDFVLLDTMGELARFYGIGKIGVVGGSFAPIGGHNLLEAAQQGIPVIYGPHMQKQPEMVELFNTENGGCMIASDELESCLERLLTDEDFRREQGRKAFNAAQKNFGAAARTLEIIESLLDTNS